LNLDNRTVREAANADPAGFIADLDADVVIDEVQRAPELILEIKAELEARRQPGRFLLTGSANLLHSRRITEVLTGRVELVQMWPLSQAEIEGGTSNVIDRLLAADVPRIRGAPKGRNAFVDRVAAGGYPEPRERSERRRRRWFTNYLTTTLERDLRDVADVYKEKEMPRLLRVLAARSAQLANWADIARELSIADKTVAAYTKLLEAIFLVRVVPAWRPSFLQRVLHTPKVYVADSGLLCHLLGANSERVATDDRVTGLALETFVGMELIKQASSSEALPSIFHFRDRDGAETDLVLEAANGDVAAVEVKAAASVGGTDLRGLRKLRERGRNRFKAGVVVYSGADTLRMEDRIWAMPVSGLWV
jgi:uncharacterized protein